MTDKEIIKALECCSEENKCQQCPYYNKGNFKCPNYKFFKDLLDLINRQQADNQKLKGHLEQLKSRYDNAKAEIEKLKKLTKDRADVNFDEIVRVVDRARADIKSEAIKEFAERLKENKIDIDVSFGYGKEVYTEAVAVIEIDNLVKEMVGK